MPKVRQSSISRLRQIYHGIHDIDLSRYDADELRSARSAPLLATTFAARMRVRDRIAEWKEAALLQPRDRMGASRRVPHRPLRRRHAGRDRLKNARLAPGETSKRGFTGTTRTRSSTRNSTTAATFRSSRAMFSSCAESAHNSAAIARIGDVDTQFSHVAIIYIDDEGKHWVVEALIEDGSVINTLEHVLDHGLGRAVLYRHKDAALAARAAKIVYERVLATKTGFAPHIPYDFTMRLRGRKQAVLRQARAAGFRSTPAAAKPSCPSSRPAWIATATAPSSRASASRPRKHSLRATSISIPRFDLVAEWQDYRVTPLLRRQDMIMTKLFEWMETRGYVFKEDLFIKLVAIFGRLSSHLSDAPRSSSPTLCPKSRAI